MKRNYNDTLFRASRLLSEAFDIDDPMNTMEPADEPAEETPDETEDSPVETDEPVESYDVDVANPVCPCCGARLNIVDTELTNDEPDITAMDPSLEPDNSNMENDDTYVSINDVSDDDDSVEAVNIEDEDEDDDDKYTGETVEAF